MFISKKNQILQYKVQEFYFKLNKDGSKKKMVLASGSILFQITEALFLMKFVKLYLQLQIM